MTNDRPRPPHPPASGDDGDVWVRFAGDAGVLAECPSPASRTLDLPGAAPDALTRWRNVRSGAIKMVIRSTSRVGTQPVPGHPFHQHRHKIPNRVARGSRRRTGTARPVPRRRQPAGRTRPAAPPPRRPPEPHPRMSTHGPRLRPAGQLEPGTATTPQGATSSQGRRRADAHRSAANPSRPNSSRTGYGPANPMTHLKSGPVKPRCQHRSWCSISRRTRAGAAPCHAGLRAHRPRG